MATTSAGSAKAVNSRCRAEAEQRAERHRPRPQRPEREHVCKRFDACAERRQHLLRHGGGRRDERKQRDNDSTGRMPIRVSTTMKPITIPKFQISTGTLSIVIVGPPSQKNGTAVHACTPSM